MQGNTHVGYPIESIVSISVLAVKYVMRPEQLALTQLTGDTETQGLLHEPLELAHRYRKISDSMAVYISDFCRGS